jgi:hypothetical protein
MNSGYGKLLLLLAVAVAVARTESIVNMPVVVRAELFTAMTMKNVVFWDIETQFVLHRRHITSPLQSADS